MEDYNNKEDKIMNKDNQRPSTNNKDKLGVKFSRDIKKPVDKYTDNDLFKAKTKSILQTITALIVAILIGLGFLYIANSFSDQIEYEFVEPNIEAPETNIEFEGKNKDIEAIEEKL